MAIKVMFFGQLVDITGKHNLEVNGVADTLALQQHMQAAFPALGHITYRIAVDKKIVTENTPLRPETTVALLPPFSGG